MVTVMINKINNDNNNNNSNDKNNACQPGLGACGELHSVGAMVNQITIVSPAHHQDDAMLKPYSENQMCFALPPTARSQSCCIIYIHEASQQTQCFEDTKEFIYTGQEIHT